ncbi:glycosyl hydrolase [Paenibacillus tepidiphilus]|uniref:glycosyl hydrolase n=1 Tax=Paenibacillus tepidiphilus TaxID=2608683 RepID=UPI00123C1A75|nr:glycosyl hydrolase [Paenibacillus tepidiphilus]
MKKKSFKQGLLLLLIGIMIISTAAPTLAASRLPEKLEGHWAEEAIAKWMQNGVVQGYPDGSFKPDRAVTRAELTAIINKMFGFSLPASTPFADVPQDAWYAKDLAVAKQAGYYKGYPGNEAKADTAVTRQDAAALLAAVFSLNPATGAGKAAFTDSASISDYALEPIQALSGILNGYPDGSFRPERQITRAETVSILDRLVSRFYNQSGTFTAGDIAGNALVSRSGVTLQNGSISGRLYLAPGIGDGDAVVSQVSVQGAVYVQGGGGSSIHFQEAKLNQVQVNRLDGKVRVVLEGKTEVTRLHIVSASILDLGTNAVISELLVDSGAEGTVVTGKGEIKRLEIKSAVTLNGRLLAPGVYAVRNGDIAGSGTVISAGTGNTGGGNSGGGDGGQTVVKTVYIADAEATPATRSLLAYLGEMSGKQIMFGHQHDTTVSISGKDENGKVISDVYGATGDYPAVFGWDTLSLDGYETPPGVAGDYEASREGLSAAMKEAYELGGIVTLSTHPYNFATGGSFNDTSNTKGATSSVVTRILPGGDKNADFNAYLDRIADFANHLQDDESELIPVLFRPFHEQNGSWFWWGAGTTTKSEYATLYRYTVEYLRDIKGVHNFLYVFSPNGSFGGNESEYLNTYPGDAYVDILGMDQYDSKDNAGSQGFLDGLVKDLNMISKLASAKNKIVTLSEYGYSAAGMKTTGNNELEWFTKVLNAIKADPDASRISYMLTWANFGEGNNLYVPYKNVPNKADHELLPDFVRYYNDPFTAFAGEVKEDNKYNREVKAGVKEPLLHIVTPTDIGTVTAAETVIRAKVSGVTPDKVVFSVGGSDVETAMTLGADGYYSAVWKPEAALNGTSVDIAVKAYRTEAAPLSDSVTVFVKIGEVPLLELGFDTADELRFIQNNGTWSGLAGNGDTIKTELRHADVGGNGKLDIHVTAGLDAADTWQELKLQLTPEALQGVDLAKAGRVKLDVLIPANALDTDDSAALRTVVQLPDDWNTKYGMDSSYKKLSELEKVGIEGTEYYRYAAAVELSDSALTAAAKGLAVSIVGSGLASAGELPVYVDNIGVYNVYTAPVADNALVDDFESYGASNDALQAKYPKAGGDDIAASLSADRKAGGKYGMKLDYNLGAAGYAGIGKNLGSLDWSDYNAVSMWIASEGDASYAETGAPLKLVVQLVIDGIYLEAYPQIAPDSEGRVVFALKDLTEMSWGASGPLTLEKLEKVQSFKLYINSMDGQAHEGTLFFDDIQAVYDPSLPDFSGGNEGPQPHEPGVLYPFKSVDDIAGWTAENGSTANAGAVEYSGEEQAAAVPFELKAGGSFELGVYPSGLNLSGLETLSAKVKLSAGSAKARLFIKTAGWKWSDSGTPVTIDSGGYTTLSISLPAAAAAEGVDLSSVLSIGIKVEEIAGGEGTAKLYLQEVALAAAAPEISYRFENGAED